MAESFDPTPEEQNVVLIDSRVLHQAERLIAGCAACSPEDAEFPFDAVLDQVTGNDPAVTDYIMRQPAMCPICRRPILEKHVNRVGGVNAAQSARP